MLKLLGFGADRRVFGGGSEGGGGSDDGGSQNVTTTIKSGDTLSNIAAKNNTTVGDLMAANPNITNPNQIYAGDTLNIPVNSREEGESVYSGMDQKYFDEKPATTTTTTTSTGSGYTFGSTPVGSLPAAPTTSKDKAVANMVAGKGTTPVVGSFDDEYARLSLLGGIPDLAIKSYTTSGTVLPGYETLISNYTSSQTPSPAQVTPEPEPSPPTGIQTLVSEPETPATKVENTAGLSTRVNTSSDDPYEVVNDKGYTVFSSSSKSAADKYIKENTKDEYLDARGNTYATQKEADAANKALFAASEQETRRDTAALAESLASGTAPQSTGTLIGSVSPQGTYAGDGFEWKQTSSGALTRVYTGANENLGLGTDTVSANTADRNLKETIAQVSLNEGSSYAQNPASATDTSLWSLITTGDPGGSASYADQVGASSPVAGPTGTDFTYAGSFNEAFKDARSTLGPGQTFTYGGKEYSTATAEERPDLAGPPATGIQTLVPSDPRLDLSVGTLPAAPYTPLIPTDPRLGLTAGALPAAPQPVIDLGEINIPLEPEDYSYDPLADVLQSQFEEMRASPLSTGTTLVDLATARAGALLPEGIASIIASQDPSQIGVTVSPTGEVDAFYQPTTPTAAEQYFRDLAAEGRGTEAQIFSQMSPTLQQEVLNPIFTTQAGYDVGQVDPRLAAAAGLDPNELVFDPKALGTQAILSAPSTLIPLGVAAVNPVLGYTLGAGMTVGEGSREVSDAFDAAYRSGEVQQSQLYQDMLARTGGDEAAALAAVKNQVMNTATPMLTALGAGSTAIARNVSNIGGIITRALGVPASRTGATLAGAGVEAATEGLEEGFLEKAAIAQPAAGLTGQDIYPTFEQMLGEGAVGALTGGGLGIVTGVAQPTTPFVQTSYTSPSPPFIPASPLPGFTPGPGAAATMTVDGTATDVTPGFTPTGPGVGQIAQTPTGILTAYQQAADTLGEAGIRNIGGAPATMMDVAAATEIINNEIAETGGLSPETALNLERATGLSATSIKDIAESAPRVGTARDTLITDVVTGTGGGGQIQVTSNPNGTYTLKNLTTGNPQHVATVEPGQSLDEAIKVFDEVTTVGSPEAITVDTAGTATLPSGVTEPTVTPAAEPSTAIVPRTQTEALTGIGTAGTTGIGSLTTVGAGTQVGTAQPVDLTADSQTTSEILEFTPTEDFIEGTAVEIAGQIPGTVATQTTPTTTTTATQTTPTTGVFTFAEDFEPPPEEPALLEVEEEPGAGAEEPDTEVTIQEAVDEAAEEEEAPFECPDGYTAVKLGGRWVCQKTETSTVGRPTVGTRPYLSKVGFAGPSPYPSSTRTVTRTVTAAE